MMKKRFRVIIILFFSFTIIGLACAKKSMPVITSRTTESIKKEKKPINIMPDLAAGKIIFTNRCGNCHDLPLPEQFTEKRWDGILSYMIPRARLNDEQGIHVMAYVKANAGK